MRTRTTRTTVRSFAVVASVSFLLTGCSGADTASSDSSGSAQPASESAAPAVRGDEDLIIWAEPDRVEYIQQVADAFAEENGISVGVQGIVNTRQDFITANSASNGPDVLAGAHDWIGQLVQNGAVDPLQLSPDDLEAYSETAVDASTYRDQLYALPYMVESVALYCNTEYAPDTYSSIEDVIAASQSAVDDGTIDVPLVLQQGQLGDAYHMQPLFTSAGGYIFGRDAEGNYDPTDLGLNTPDSIAAAEKIATLGEDETNTIRRSISSDNYLSLFTEGRAGCMVSGPWALPDVREALGEDYSIQPVPGFEGMQPAEPFMGSQGFMVASNGENKAFAEEFVTNGINSEEAMQTLFEASNQPPAMESVREGVTDEDVLMFATAADEGAPMPAIPAMAEVFAPLGQAWSAIIGGADPAETMNQTQETIANAIASQ
ncbi:extracellular solute-binding protein [Arthrobacter echini]|uniref:Extracellular solute-binding protein n=1 Tax=Arthrobacter echini TaxID=1529066 RepID=A0A4S5E5J8_9MICC|nr:extracellular solute-binding protein [Arthrobacter echini]THJ66712.1 extracellular solute-binding protein [Arthrobacter echini]